MNDSLPQKIKDFFGFPLKLFLEHDAIRKLGLTSFQDERFNVCLKYVRGEVLDIGCGAGNEFIRKIGQGIGLDPYPWPGVDIIAPAEKMPFEAKIFDTITLMVTLRYIKDRDKALQEIKRILKDDGVVLILENNPWINRLRLALISWNPYKNMEAIQGLTKKEIKKLLERNGLKLKRVVYYLYGLGRMYVVTK